MVKYFKDFRDTLSERIRSPYVGSFMITWIVYHWKMVTLFIYSEPNLPIQSRIEKIEGYLNNQDDLSLLIWPVIITLGVLVLYNILNAIGLAIKLAYDNWLSPFIQLWLYNNSIIEKTKYENLKVEYKIIKDEYEINRDIYYSTDKENKDLKNAYQTLKDSAFEAAYIDDLTKVFNQNISWKLICKYPDGNSTNEILRIEKDGFVINDGIKIKIINIRKSVDGRILSFEKITGKQSVVSYLVGCSGIFTGFEGDEVEIFYMQLKPPIIKIDSAKYCFEQNFIDVTAKVQNIVDLGQNKFMITNAVMSGDPGYGKQKILKIEYRINNIKKSIIANENDTIKLE